MCFGKYDWYVLDKQDDRVLIITEKVIEKHPYHNAAGIKNKQGTADK